MPTYAQLMQEVARRTGPFFQAAQDSGSPTSSTSIAAYMPTLRSSAVLGGPENLFLVRRGVLADGVTATPSPITADDRTRMVQSFDSSAGRVVVDRNWRDPMQPGELADFIHLHPDQELPRAVHAGLRRCFFADTVQVDPTSILLGAIDLTAQLPWCTGTWQVDRVQYGWTAPTSDAPFEATLQSGHVVIQGMFGTLAPIAVWVTLWHPHFNWINEADSTTGPVADSDQLGCDLDYAAGAGHIEAWHLFPSRMQVAAAGGFQTSQKDAATEFTRQAITWGPKRPTRMGFATTFRLPLSWVNR